jgi:hypothetical protein
MGEIPGFNVTAMAMIMNNKFPESYSRGTGGNNSENTSITINNLNLTPAQINDRIAQKLERFKSLGIELETGLLPEPIEIVVEDNTEDE